VRVGPAAVSVGLEAIVAAKAGRATVVAACAQVDGFRGALAEQSAAPVPAVPRSPT